MRYLYLAIVLFSLAACSAKERSVACKAHGKHPPITAESCEKLQGPERDYCLEAISKTAPPERAAPGEVEEAPAADQGNGGDVAPEVP